MAITLRQTKIVTGSGGSGVVTLDSVPLLGSLLVATGARRQASAGTTFTPANWTAGPNAFATDGAISFDAWTSAYRKVNGDSANITFNWSSGGGSNVWRIIVMEFVGLWPEQASILFGSDTSEVGPGTSSALTCGPVAITPNKSAVWVLGACIRSNAATATTPDFVEVSDGSDGGVHPSHYAGYLIDTSTPNDRSQTITFSAAAQSGGGLMAFLEDLPPTGGGDTGGIAGLGRDWYIGRVR